ncbi:MULTISPECIES: hypothetical protein [Capnocytophaga]|jgi:hypothetical protein|uniref:Peptide chain release factor 1 n=1 Tax=Capnocytophaga ochracea TaxID=1018 RepID=A0A2X2RFI4_CAPOC|nr:MULTISPECIES: hypothetical protein [Capnocytophaga]ALC96527.1 hypothetical protein AM608_02115 [Capnocytophaga sp. oral taxon 323]SQA79192.1 Uncharacterised protein [Capnocytophaga ochracea]
MNIDELISKGEKLGKSIYKDPNYNKDICFPYDVYKTKEEDEYQNWISIIKRLIKSKYSSELNDFEKLSIDIDPENHRKILALLNAIKEIPDEPKKGSTKQEKNFHFNITQSQNQQTSVSINLIIEAFQDELNGKQQKEIQTIIDDKELEPEKKKSKIVETLKKFGGDIASNILANILTNPSFFGF